MPAPVQVSTNTLLWVVMYLHDWDEGDKVYPQVHSIHTTWQAAEAVKATRIDPSRYHVTSGNIHN